jgi:hypothetical protein
LALAREWHAHVGFVVTIAAAASLILRRALATRTRLRVDPLDLLRIAVRHLRNFRRDLQCFAQPRLRGPLASFANRQRDLVTGSSVVGGSAENVPCHQQQRRVVIERSARIAAQLGLRFAKTCQHLTGNFKA